VPEALLLLVLVPLLVSLWAIRRRRTTDLTRPSGQSDEGAGEPSQGTSDMTLVGKVALAGLFVAALVLGVLRVAGGGPGWVVVAALAVGALCLATGIVSERRRTRREGVDPGQDRGRVPPDD
jgi:hypothetical protein